MLPNALQSAIDAVPTVISPGDSYVIRVARNGSYSGRNYSLFNRSLVIEGGYATCSSATPDSTNTEIDAAGAPSGRALDINGGTARRNIVLQRLTVKNSDGGGLEVRSADVRLERVTVSDNTALRGVGILVDGNGAGAIVRLQGGSIVTGNTATEGGGGGIYCNNGAELRLASASAVVSNTAATVGGGILLYGCDAVVNSGATGLGGLVVNIGFNKALAGGGIAAISDAASPPSRLRIGEGLGGGDPRPLVVGNDGGVGGGGILANGPQTTVSIRNATIGSNIAVALGGGVVAENGATVEIKRTLRRCIDAQECSRIVNNRADQGGAAWVGQDARLTVEGTRVEGNQATSGGSAYMVAGGVAYLKSRNNVIVGNTGASAVDITPPAGTGPLMAVVEFQGDTLADNTGGAAVINVNTGGSVLVAQTIVHAAPSLPVFQFPGSDPWIQMGCNVFHRTTVGYDYDEMSTVFTNPGFIDAAGGNYRLLPNAWAIDRCPDDLGFLHYDHDLNPRPVDSPLPDIHGPYDVGAYEWNQILFQDGFGD